MLIETNCGKILRYLRTHPDAYGSQIARACQIKPSAIYTTLQRMERERLVTSVWGSAGPGARRKHYTLRSS